MECAGGGATCETGEEGICEYGVTQCVGETLEEAERNLELSSSYPDLIFPAAGLFPTILDLRQAGKIVGGRLLREDALVAEQQVERLLALHNRVTIRAGNQEDENVPVDRLKARRSAEPSRCAHKERVENLVEQWICQLSDKQQAVLERRFGLHGYRRATLEQIGAEIGVTRERVRQLEKNALAKLRRQLDA